MEGKNLFVGLFVIVVIRYAKACYTTDYAAMTEFFKKNNIGDPVSHMAYCLHEYIVHMRGVVYDPEEASRISENWHVKRPALGAALKDLEYLILEYETKPVSFNMVSLINLISGEPYSSILGMRLVQGEDNGKFKDVSVRFGKSNYILNSGPYPPPREIVYLNPSTHDATKISLYIALWK